MEVLTDIIFMINDRVEWKVSVLYVSLCWLNIKGPTVSLDESFKFSINNRPMSKTSLLTC